MLRRFGCLIGKNLQESSGTHFFLIRRQQTYNHVSCRVNNFLRLGALFSEYHCNGVIFPSAFAAEFMSHSWHGQSHRCQWTDAGNCKTIKPTQEVRKPSKQTVSAKVRCHFQSCRNHPQPQVTGQFQMGGSEPQIVATSDLLSFRFCVLR